MILGSCTAGLSLLIQAGIPCPGFFGAASAFPLELDLVSASSEDLAGVGATGGTTGTAVEPSSTITTGNRTAGTSVTGASITVISPTAATVISATATSAMAMRSTEVRVFTGVALITAEMPEASLRAVARAS